MGVEPTDAGITDVHAVLKTGKATRPLPPPSASDAVYPQCNVNPNGIRFRL